MTKRLSCFLFVFFMGYVACAIGAEVMPEEYDVTINNIVMSRSVAEKIFRHIKRGSSNSTVIAHDAKKNTAVLAVKKDMDVIIENNFMATVFTLYQSCLHDKNVEKFGEDRRCTNACENERCVSLCIDKDEKLIDLLIY